MLAKLQRLSCARILLVDDDIVNRHIISTELHKAGFHEIDTADDGAEALKKTYMQNPDLVLLDLNMPNLDGFGYCEHVRNNSHLPRMPIIVQTIIDERAAKLRALACGADDFLHKPLDIDELALRVSGHLERYFMLQDIENMCSYLQMELLQVKGVVDRLESSHASPPLLNLLSRHCDVMETMMVLPTMTFSS